MPSTDRISLRDLSRQSAATSETAERMFSRLTAGNGRRIVWNSWESVTGTAAEHRSWREATRRFQNTVREAETELHRVEASWWHRLLPGTERRRRRTADRHREAIEAAVEAYRPVIEEIERRRVEAEAERRRREDELRRQAFERHKREERRRRKQEKLYRAVAARAVWSWALTEKKGTRTVWVYRHDVPPAHVPAAPVRRSREPLTAAALEKDLLALGEEARPAKLKCRWDAGARTAVVRECTVEESAGSFDDWWSMATRRYWETPSEIPVGTDRSTRGIRPNPGTSHHGSHGVGGFSCAGGF